MTDYEDIATCCRQVINGIHDFAISEKFCEDLQQLERKHDILAHEVAKLAEAVGNLALAAAARSDETNADLAQSEGRQSGPNEDSGNAHNHPKDPK